ncbi:hypothetical protein E4T82_07310 [Streptococcus cuniculi]|uniref:Uncharacterized protein n=1 Tax=Streptococcus cuniculi TaxID=1432788 RepID=A0A4Y9J9P2_9STRE|nr:hypothetical protein E4T82_07310 [Streptococcus cuniculi]
MNEILEFLINVRDDREYWKIKHTLSNCAFINRHTLSFQKAKYRKIFLVLKKSNPFFLVTLFHC